ncbi:efflux RND transporter periplasmic adaptor subunit [Hoeflea prorocentri]|uniref:Efflux RND transporter periplasmic adaptor subunit n=1 Tax=Hoeflea prorocentri TaxID=1922333 RepID=A0A9X3ZJQ4_9HYPH|nr:efflux RND transporter periplasmic adaptor subunit [Hoeflea prorocentri]MCY6383338.1 efflux RND transporter periplasmic adaptor subunit [Hoeflea prorocentri]MDA5401138.1 efflux RND transporter periplasmic adaptor subunit [Hoeflea prorocentri]
MRRIVLPMIGLITLAACGEGDNRTGDIEPVVRGLKTCIVEDVEDTTIRHYPSVLQPSSTTTLSFEVTGRLLQVNLDVGQSVNEGDVIAEIDPKSLQIQVDNAEAALRQAESTARNAEEDFNRKSQLVDQGVVTKADADQSRTNMETSQAQVVQAAKQLETAKENLDKSVLRAPFNGIISSVDVQSFTNVTAGAPVATIYADDRFESSFTVSFDVVNRIAVGKNATVRLADDPAVVLPGHISELGSRADSVSAFPVVVTLDETNELLKAGMAVEITLEFPVPRGGGFTLPLTVMPLEGDFKVPEDPQEPGALKLFVYDDASGTVKLRDVLIGGLRDNQLIVVDGLQPGDQVACAGVSFLRDGMKVKPLQGDGA